MKTPLMYQFDLATGEYTGSRPAELRPGGESVLESLCAVPVAPPEASEGHIARWTGANWEVVEDHRQKMDDKGSKIGGTPYWLPAEGDDWQSPERFTDALGPLPEGAVTAKPVKPEPTLEEAKASKRAIIDAETSAAILGGFDFMVEGQKLHFSYDTFDQQNFADTANACILQQTGVPGLPESVIWNAYADGALVRLTRTSAEFLALYTAGALTHKATQMETGGQRKAAVEAALTLEKVEAA